MVSLNDPYISSTVFLFCNKKNDTVKALRWDDNGFVLATKKVTQEMRFLWPKKPEELMDINRQELPMAAGGIENRLA